MNLKNAYKEWQENCPDSYMINGQKRPIKWKKTESLQKQKENRKQRNSCYDWLA